MHNEGVTELLEQAFEGVRAFLHETQDEYAHVLLRLAGDDDEGTAYQVTIEEEASLAKSLQQVERGEFATDEEVQTNWAKCGP